MTCTHWQHFSFHQNTIVSTVKSSSQSQAEVALFLDMHTDEPVFGHFIYFLELKRRSA